MDRRAFLRGVSAALATVLLLFGGDTAYAKPKPRPMTAASFIWSESHAASGGGSNSQTDYTLPAATLDPSRVLAVIVHYANDHTDPAVTTTAEFATDAGFTTGVLSFNMAFGPGSKFDPITNQQITAVSGYVAIPDLTTGYVRVSNSVGVNHVQTLYLLGNVTLSTFPPIVGQTSDNNSQNANPEGWPGTSLAGFAAPTDAVVVQALAVITPETPTISASWDQQDQGYVTSAGGAYSSELLGGASYSYPSLASGAAGFGGVFYTGAEWTVSSVPRLHDVYALYFQSANLPPLVRKARTFVHLVGL